MWKWKIVLWIRIYKKLRCIVGCEKSYCLKMMNWDVFEIRSDGGKEGGWKCDEEDGWNL
jgi:hypothetical protein